MNDTGQYGVATRHGVESTTTRDRLLTTNRWFVLLVGIGVALAAFGFRFLSFRGLPNDQYMHLAWAQQLLFGEVPGRDFIEAGMPLAIALSAVAQWIARGPVSEAVLSIAMLACAAAVTWMVVTTLTRSTMAGIGAVLLEVALYPRLYSYPKILIPAVALLLMIRYTRRPATTAVMLLSAWTVVGFLLRHDLGMVTALAVTSGLLLSQLMFLICYRLYILRHPVAARIQDLATVLAIGTAWTTVEAVRMVRERGRPSWAAVGLATVTSAAALTIAVGTWTLRDLHEEWRETEVSGGWQAIAERAAIVIANGSAPPWPHYWPSGAFLDAIGYIDACTAPSDRLLVTWRAPEYYYFTGRRFAAGHAQLLPDHAFLGRKDQELMVARLERQVVPIVLMNDSERSAFVASYRLVAAYITNHYEPGGQFVIYDGSQITILVRKDLTPSRTYGPNRWPCGFTPLTTTGAG